MNTVSMNNIYHVWKPNNGAFYQIGPDAQFQNDMTNAVSTPEVGGIVATPKYAGGSGWQSGIGGMYQLASGTPGFDQAKRIPNFNDHFNGAAPDVGAAEAGDGAMKFGLAAASATGGIPGSTGTTDSGTSTGGTSGGSTGGTSGATGGTSGSGTSTSNAGTGAASVSATMDASAYTLRRRQSVTLTAKLMGNAGTPTGTVAFQDGTSTIAGCASVAIANGTASCTTKSLSSGRHPLRGYYSGNATYGAGIAGPITITVK
jgi:hypothetical protein